ncbi:3-hydroxyacyl-ACP dehydratase FabZ family protein [Rosistilla oblonga]|uniref:3-hydroxyacyl-ACP dehydratase FabZ family protein n=1 Tax=Rosistilla oblonga TaxID=2527990 RepID=UPI003A96CB57
MKDTQDQLNLPYGDAFLFVDRVVAIRPSECIETEKRYSSTHPIVEAHFADGPKVVPGVILVEQICQTALLLGIRSGMFDTKSPPLLGEIKARFPTPAVADCVITSRVTMDTCIRRAVHFQGQAFRANAIVCSMSGLIVLGDGRSARSLVGDS